MPAFFFTTIQEGQLLTNTFPHGQTGQEIRFREFQSSSIRSGIICSTAVLNKECRLDIYNYVIYILFK